MPGKRSFFEIAPFRFLIFLFFGGLAALAVGGVVMLLWNAVLPSLVGVKEIGYWQSVGLLILCRILFGSFRPRRGKPRHMGPSPQLREKLMNMSDEERKAFKEEMRRRCSSRNR
jgi:Ca2+/H+ antiporter, TMEM165/GDT1 family